MTVFATTVSSTVVVNMINISASEAAANATEQAKKLLKAGVGLLVGSDQRKA